MSLLLEHNRFLHLRIRLDAAIFIFLHSDVNLDCARGLYVSCVN